ncbi:LLM class flavin-dependent oxidoreductase [Pseudofrankia inefficax]|uniref:Luciferase-like, subgroup n=1 Tax=Pseudofrankia inefficax (strain DSM 45817 / CECT 9037 / DDB 130130 / EuI1c) TaxID=298654 RepID=E3J904_PSEI1|nr:LLM class flavin-dependent oxidoreductase [Pseudofrankia inefficax]ADP80883.1 Luciferase-like, subgroup [Pseudofrankia inefficax]
MTFFGVHAGPQMCTMDELRQVWRASEDLGFDWVSIWDHFYANPRAFDESCFEAVASQAALAATTSRVRVGSLVYSAGYRHPAVLANAAVTIDHISNGRLELGVGAGWHKPEYEGYGIPFETPGVRLRRLAESIEIIRALWTTDVVDYDGEFYTLRGARCVPKPVQPSARIWVGGTQPKALALASRLGDAWNVAAVSPKEFEQKYEIVRQNAPDPDRLATGVNLVYVGVGENGLEAELRKRLYDPTQSQLTDNMLVADDMSRVADRVKEYVDAGVQWIILNIRAPFDLDPLRRFAEEVIPLFRS